MPTSDVYGNILDAYQIQNAAVEVLTDWIPWYLREVERQRNRTAGDIPLPKSITTINRFSRAMLENQLPSVITVSPGLVGQPVRESRGYRATWELGVAVIVSAATPQATDEISKIYTAAVRGIILQQKLDLGGFRGITWIDERYDDLEPDAARSMAVGQNLFEVEFENVTDWKKGPRTLPSGDPLLPPAPVPTVQPGEADVEVVKL